MTRSRFFNFLLAPLTAIFATKVRAQSQETKKQQLKIRKLVLSRPCNYDPTGEIGAYEWISTGYVLSEAPGEITIVIPPGPNQTSVPRIISYGDERLARITTTCGG